MLESDSCIEFVFPCGQPKIYIGYLWINATVVHVIPRIQAAPDKPNDNFGIILYLINVLRKRLSFQST